MKILFPDFHGWELKRLLYASSETSQYHSRWNKWWCFTEQSCLSVQNGKE